jgi:hypothetical protein
MATGRQLVSDVRSIHKILSTDALITDRLILSEIKTEALLLIKRETNLRKLWATDTLFTTIPCLEMEEVSISECCSYADPCSIARSKYKLPQIAEGNYQYVIQGVYSIDALSGNGKKLKEITVNRYINLLKLPIIKNQVYYWITNEYLYITNPNAQAVRLVAFFEEDVPNSIMYPECGCGDLNHTVENVCVNPLDKDVHIPGYLIKQVLDQVSNKLLQTYFRIKTDMATDGIDGQSSNAPNLK